jgi:hypothetical protein
MVSQLAGSGEKVLTTETSLLRNTARRSELGSSSEHGNEPSGSIKCGEFLVSLNDYEGISSMESL